MFVWQLRTSTAGDIVRGILPSKSHSDAFAEPKYEKCEGELLFYLKDLGDHRAGIIYHDLPRNGSIGIIFRFHEPVPCSLIGDPLNILIHDQSEHERLKALTQLVKLVGIRDEKLAFKFKLDCIEQGLVEEMIPLLPAKALHKHVCQILYGFILIRGNERDQCVMRLILQNYTLALGLLDAFDAYISYGNGVTPSTLELLKELFLGNRPALTMAIDTSPYLLEQVKAHSRHNDSSQKILEQLSSGKDIAPQVKDAYNKVKIDGSYAISPGQLTE